MTTLWTTEGALVDGFRHSLGGAQSDDPFPPVSHMSEEASSLRERIVHAGFHKPYYHPVQKEEDSSRRWAR